MDEVINTQLFKLKHYRSQVWTKNLRVCVILKRDDNKVKYNECCYPEEGGGSTKINLMRWSEGIWGANKGRALSIMSERLCHTTWATYVQGQTGEDITLNLYGRLFTSKAAKSLNLCAWVITIQAVRVIYKWSWMWSDFCSIYNVLNLTSWHCCIHMKAAVWWHASNLGTFTTI